MNRRALSIPSLLFSNEELREKLHVHQIDPDLFQRYADPEFFLSDWAATPDLETRRFALLVLIMEDHGNSLEALLQEEGFHFPGLSFYFVLAAFFDSPDVIRVFMDFYDRNKGEWVDLTAVERNQRIAPTYGNLFDSGTSQFLTILSQPSLLHYSFPSTECS
jgi:hypothetical protein